VIDEKTRHDFGVVQTCHDEMDRQWQHLLERNRERPITEGLPMVEVMCRQGCAACCTQLPDASYAEGALIAWQIESTGGSDKEEAIARLLSWEAEFARWMRTNPLVDPVANYQEHLLWRSRWHARRIACPFLEMADHSCAIYPDRPTVCRAHHAARPPAGTDVPNPPEACFPDPAMLERGELRSVWQLNHRLSEQFSEFEYETFQKEGVSWATFILPITVLAEGRRRFGWPLGSDRTGPVRVLEHPLAPGLR
jgi:Fe-S-cluster containining protein